MARACPWKQHHHQIHCGSSPHPAQSDQPKAGMQESVQGSLSAPEAQDGTRERPEGRGLPESQDLPVPGIGSLCLPCAPGQHPSSGQNVHTNPGSDLGGLGGAWASAFLTDSQVLPILLVYGSRFPWQGASMGAPQGHANDFTKTMGPALPPSTSL